MLLRSIRRFNIRLATLSAISTCSNTTTAAAQEVKQEGLQFTTLKPVETQPSVPPRLARKEFLPGSTGEGFPDVLSPPLETFPHAVQVENPNGHSINEHAVSCKRYLNKNLAKYGAVLLRNLPLKTVADFSSLCQGLGYKGMTYEGGAVEREELDRNSGTYTSSDEPPQAVIEPHNEMAYSPAYPAKVTQVHATILSIEGVVSTKTNYWMHSFSFRFVLNIRVVTTYISSVIPFFGLKLCSLIPKTWQSLIPDPTEICWSYWNLLILIPCFWSLIPGLWIDPWSHKPR